MPFDLPGAGISAGQVESAELILNCTTVVGGGCDVELLTSTIGFGATLDAAQADWELDNYMPESTVDVSATGTYTWTLDPNSLSYSGISYLALWDTDEGIGASFQTAAVFSSVQAGTPSNRPVLRLTLTSGQVIYINQSEGLG